MHDISKAEMPFRETITNTRTENKKEAVLGFEPLTSTYLKETQFEHRPARGNTKFFVTNAPIYVTINTSVFEAGGTLLRKLEPTATKSDHHSRVIKEFRTRPTTQSINYYSNFFFSV
jgi:hypothetical protein